MGLQNVLKALGQSAAFLDMVDIEARQPAHQSFAVPRARLRQRAPLKAPQVAQKKPVSGLL